MAAALLGLNSGRTHVDAASYYGSSIIRHNVSTLMANIYNEDGTRCQALLVTVSDRTNRAAMKRKLVS